MSNKVRLVLSLKKIMLFSYTNVNDCIRSDVEQTFVNDFSIHGVKKSTIRDIRRKKLLRILRF